MTMCRGLNPAEKAQAEFDALPEVIPCQLCQNVFLMTEMAYIGHDGAVCNDCQWWGEE